MKLLVVVMNKLLYLEAFVVVLSCPLFPTSCETASLKCGGGIRSGFFMVFYFIDKGGRE
jgi:hypothetical protein